MKLQNGVNKILFSCGKLYLNGVQIGGEGILPQKDILFEFQVKPEEVKEEPVKEEEHPDILEVNVFDSIPAGDYGPGQK